VPKIRKRESQDSLPTYTRCCALQDRSAGADKVWGWPLADKGRLSADLQCPIHTADTLDCGALAFNIDTAACQVSVYHW